MSVSNVLKRHRNLSEYEFYQNAIKLRREVMSLTNNEKIVPKRRRMVIGNKTLTHALDIVIYIAKANASFPSSPTMVAVRKLYQQKAICECEALIECLRAIMDLGNSRTNSKIMSVVYTASSEISLLRRWKKSTKLLGNAAKNKSSQNESDGAENANTTQTPTPTTVSASINDIDSKLENNLIFQLVMILDEITKSSTSF